MDIFLTPDSFGQGDIVPGTGDLVKDDGLRTAVYISIFTKKGSWWADPEFGSDLHTIERDKATAETISKAKNSVEDSLVWLIDDGAISSFTVDVERLDGPLLGIQIQAFRPEGTDSKYSFTWEAMN